MGPQPQNPTILNTLLIINLVENLNLYVFISFHFQFKNLCLALPFKFNYKPSMLISCTFVSLVKSEGNCFMVTSIKFAILVESNCNCTMLICCIFASLVRSNFNFSMGASFTLYLWSNLIAIFPGFFLTLVYCHLFYFKIILN